MNFDFKFDRCEPLAVPVLKKDFEAALAPFLRGQKITRLSVLTGGFSNTNFKVEVDSSEAPFVVRVSGKPKAEVEAELSVVEMLGKTASVPSVLYSYPPMVIRMKKVLIAFLASLIFILPSYAVETLKYEPSVVTLRGTLSLQDFAGPPNYEDVKQGDRLERSWVFVLNHPIRVVASPDDELFYTQENVKEIQLVCPERCSKKFALSIGKDATLIGTLFPAHTGHHHKGVLMNVQKRK